MGVRGAVGQQDEVPPPIRRQRDHREAHVAQTCAARTRAARTRAARAPGGVGQMARGREGVERGELLRLDPPGEEASALEPHRQRAPALADMAGGAPQGARHVGPHAAEMDVELVLAAPADRVDGEPHIAGGEAVAGRVRHEVARSERGAPVGRPVRPRSTGASTPETVSVGMTTKWLRCPARAQDRGAGTLGVAEIHGEAGEGAVGERLASRQVLSAVQSTSRVGSGPARAGRAAMERATVAAAARAGRWPGRRARGRGAAGARSRAGRGRSVGTRGPRFRMSGRGGGRGGPEHGSRSPPPR